MMLIRTRGDDLPGASYRPGPDRPADHENIHVASPGRKGRQDLFGMTRADAEAVTWELVGELGSRPREVDLRAPQIHGAPGKRFISPSWGTLDRGSPALSRRAKLGLDAVPPAVMDAAGAHRPPRPVRRRGPAAARCSRPPLIEWSAAR